MQETRTDLQCNQFARKLPLTIDDKPTNEVLASMYLNDRMSSIDIARVLLSDYGIVISSRSVQRTLKAHGVPVRTVGEAFKLAMANGKMAAHYAAMRKNEKDKAQRTRISEKLRFEILNRDNFHCKLCGNVATAENPLQIDHIDGNATNNDRNNLQVLCRECNLGKYHALRNA
ncbi:unnamed protein product [Sphagnum balticum]